MRWIRSGLQSLSGWRQPPRLPGARASSEQLEAIRRAMLKALGPAGELRRPGLAACIRLYREAETLWALRTELMAWVPPLTREADARAIGARPAIQ
ncbi:MAG: hypothetical protein ABI409_17425 [Ramlibacter sp.]